MGTKKGKEMEEQGELFSFFFFLFISCLWEKGRLIGSNLYLAVECENSRIWTCGCLDLLPSPLMFSTDHSMVMVIS